MPTEEAQSFVHYHCPCTVTRIDSQATTLHTPAPGALGSAHLPLDVELSKPPPSVSFSAQPISRLYFCEECHRLKCQRCVQDDIICYYCPNCLFEVPTASVKGEKNRCMRNCFRCPSCYNTLTVIADESGRAQHNTQAAVKPAQFYLGCATCRWDSREIRLTFERATGLASQIQKIEEGRPEVLEFEHLKEFLERFMRLQSASMPAAGGFGAGSAGVSSFFSGGLQGLSGLSVQSLLARHPSASGEAGADGEGEAAYQPLPISQELEDQESKQVQEAITLTDADQVPTLKQRFHQPGEQPFNVNALRPDRIHLRVKRAKRCRSCRQVLIKPEQKAIATRFKIKLMAIHYVPTITVAQLPELRVGQPTRVVLRFANPLYFPIDVTLESPKSNEVRVLAHHFTVSDFSDVWEYEDDLGGPGSAQLLAAQSQQGATGQALPAGVFEQKGSSTCILVEITPKSPSAEFKFPIVVRYQYTETPDDEDESSPGNSDLEKDEAKSESEDQPSAGVRKDYRFWVTVGLGPVRG